MLSPESLWRKAPAGYMFSGIGSLPHPYIDTALNFSFAHSIPFLPQLPIRNPGEFMVIQALEGMPGVSGREGGLVELDRAIWEAHSQRLKCDLEVAFSGTEDKWNAFDSLEPSPNSWTCWAPFLWELQEQRTQFAKIQIAGPMTCQWALRFKDGLFADRDPKVGSQVFRLILAKAIGMCRRLRAIGTVPLLFLDEPGFYAFSKENIRQRMALEELKIFLNTLRKEEALLGIHCCSNTEWSSLLELPIDVLSIDASLSLPFLLKEPMVVEHFVARGGRLALGLVPTGTHALKLRSYEPKILWQQLLAVWKDAFPESPDLVRRVLKEAIYTPACGLALHSVEDSEAILGSLLEIGQFVEGLA